MKNKLRNLSGFKQGPAQSMSASKYDAYSREEHKTIFPNLKFTYGGAFGTVKSVTEKTDYEKAGKPVITPEVQLPLEDWKKEFDEKKRLAHEAKLRGVSEHFSVIPENLQRTNDWINFAKGNRGSKVSEIKPEGINLNVGDSSLPPVNITNPPVVKNAKEKKSITRPDVFSEEFMNQRRNRR